MKNSPAPKSTYHHGDLRAALLTAAEEELAAKGVEGFTLRGAARRARVSHAAPAHHFKDTNAMLTALAGIAFTRLSDSMARHHAAAEPDPRSQYIASGVGYVAFAVANPALFRLMFGSARLDPADKAMRRAAEAAFATLVGDVAALRGGDPMATGDGQLDVAASWSLVHGIADLLIADCLVFVQDRMNEDRAGTIRALITRLLPL